MATRSTIMRRWCRLCVPSRAICVLGALLFLMLIYCLLDYWYLDYLRGRVGISLRIHGTGAVAAHARPRIPILELVRGNETVTPFRVLVRGGKVAL